MLGLKGERERLTVNEIKVGTKLIWMEGNGFHKSKFYEEGPVEIIERYDGLRFMVLKNSKGEATRWYWNAVDGLNFYIDKIIEPHVYSPINMTGRYRTVGD